jgi:peptidyl-prolyl cis-trans isomerase C
VDQRKDVTLYLPQQGVLVVRVASLIVLLLFVVAAGTPAAQAPPPPAPAPAAAAKPVPAQLPDVLARVNGEAIAKADLEAQIQGLEARAGSPMPADRRDEIVRRLLDDLIGYRLLVQESKARNIAVPDADIEARVGEIRKQFPTEAEFSQTLAERKMTVEQLRTDMREDLAINKLLETEVESKATATTEQVDAFYKNNPDQFQQGERVKASHILIGVPEGADAAAKAAARTKAEQILAEVKKGGDFAALAKEHSTDTGSAVNGGDLGFFSPGQMVGPFNDAAFSLAAGATSDLVETQFGFHIIRVIDKQAQRTVPLAEVRPQVEQFLSNRNRQEQTLAFVNALRAKGTVEVLI